MKIAVPSTDKNSRAAIDQHFGRAKYFAIYKHPENEFEFIENPGCSVSSGAGPNAVQLMLNYGVDVIIAYRIGPKAKDVLTSTGIKFYETSASTIEEAITNFLNTQNP